MDLAKAHLYLIRIFFCPRFLPLDDRRWTGLLFIYMNGRIKIEEVLQNKVKVEKGWND
ncbi:hypothetical protein GCM10022628_20180 [Anoxybacillus suryakundensis]